MENQNEHSAQKHPRGSSPRDRREQTDYPWIQQHRDIPDGNLFAQYRGRIEMNQKNLTQSEHERSIQLPLLDNLTYPERISAPSEDETLAAPNGIDPVIHIAGINRDKTRRLNPTDTTYQIYFELSGSPSSAWRILFEKQWKTSNKNDSKTRPEIEIDRKFLVIHCPLNNIADLLPLLKTTVATTNIQYRAQQVAEAEKEKKAGKLWKEERAEVDRVADMLVFDK